MPTQYSIEVDLNDPATLQFLKGKSLFVFKGVKSDGEGLPTVWVEISDFADSAKITWSENYAGYVSSGGMPAPGVALKDLSFEPMNLGQLLTAQNSGQVVVDNTGRAGGIVVKNSGTRDWTCGMGQTVNGQFAPLCAFDLGGIGEKILMEPYEKVLLVVESSAQMDVGTVVAEAISASCTVFLDGTNTSRKIVFRKDTGWTSNTEGWVSINDDNLQLAPVLIMPNA